MWEAVKSKRIVRANRDALKAQGVDLSLYDKMLSKIATNSLRLGEKEVFVREKYRLCGLLGKVVNGISGGSDTSTGADSESATDSCCESECATGSALRVQIHKVQNATESGSESESDSEFSDSASENGIDSDSSGEIMDCEDPQEQNQQIVVKLSHLNSLTHQINHQSKALRKMHLKMANAKIRKSNMKADRKKLKERKKAQKARLLEKLREEKARSARLEGNLFLPSVKSFTPMAATYAPPMPDDSFFMRFTSMFYSTSMQD
jgi:hypothetical protein